MKVDLFDYELPRELIASRPPVERDGARLLLVDRAGGLSDRHVRDLALQIEPGSLVVLNDTRVIPARLFASKPTGGRVELLLIERVSSEGPGETWRALVRSSKPLREGGVLRVEGEGDLEVRIVRARDESGAALVLLVTPDGSDVLRVLDRVGHVPLPPYMGRGDDAADRERYQTVFARVPGAVAAPTAGLHLSEALLEALRSRGVTFAAVTLHVSLGTFKPVEVDDLDLHPMHEERLEVGAETAEAIAAAREDQRPVVAVGTTVVRALESAADPERPGRVLARTGGTRLLIQPGYAFRVVDRLMTNFHLPRSTLLALVSAFAGRERVLAAYAHAVRERYRFFSYGDAMLLDRERPE